MDGGSAGFAYVHGWTVVGQCRSSEAVCRGAKTCHAAYGLKQASIPCLQELTGQQ